MTQTAQAAPPVPATFEDWIRPERLEGLNVPDRYLAALDRYICYGVPTGGALRAILENDLSGAVSRLDAEGIAHIRDLTIYVNTALPGLSYGSPAHVRRWPQERERLLEQWLAAQAARREGS